MHAAPAGQGYTLIADERVAADLWQSLTAKVSQLQPGGLVLDRYAFVCSASAGRLNCSSHAAQAGCILSCRVLCLSASRAGSICGSLQGGLRRAQS